MRVIKFRGWQPSEKKMHHEGHFHFDKDGIVGLEQGVSWIGRLDIVPMQFTGLFDKLGKEIFEGDIVRVRFWEQLMGTYQSTGEVIFKDGRFAFDCHKDIPCFVPVDPNRLEVLGNAYEHPELLKG